MKNKIKKVTFNDYSDYQDTTCHTGGNYGLLMILRKQMTSI